MTYKVSKVSAAPSYDSLPVAKIVTYPLEKRDYRPYAQNILCVSDTHLHLRMWAFEVHPLPTSRLETVLYLFRNAPDTALAIVAVPASEENADMLGCCLLKNGCELPVSDAITQKLQKIALHPHNGEDLQGVYWGYTADIPLDLLCEWGGELSLAPGMRFPGNFYKICIDDPMPHLGCYFETDFMTNPYLPQNMGEFEVVSY